MSLIIDVHSHIFNAKDLPIRGYLKRRFEFKGVRGILFDIAIFDSLVSCLRHNWEIIVDYGDGKPENHSPKIIEAIIKEAGYEGLIDWGILLSKERTSIVEELLEFSNPFNVDLHTPLVTDFTFWFEQSKINEDGKDIPIHVQIDEIYESIILKKQGKIHPFVPFCPARAIAFEKKLKDPYGNPILDPYKMVEDAVKKKGFIGLKLYPAIGYRPRRNSVVEDKRKRKIPFYKNFERYSGFESQDYERVLSKIFDICIELDIPVTTHSAMGGLEAFPNSSYVFGHSGVWDYLLREDKYKNKLKLNLAHFGWHDDYSLGDPDGWAEDICNLIAKYETVYTDVGLVKAFANKKLAKNKFRDIFCYYPEVKDKILFGTDWHPLVKEKCYNSFSGTLNHIFQELIREKNNVCSQSDNDKFLGLNAVNFLGLNKNAANRNRLEEFYLKHNISKPKWVKKLEDMNI